jgi:hypothetical protein
LGYWIWVIQKGFSINAVVFGIVFRVFHSCFCADCRSYHVEKCLFNGHRFFWFCLFFFLNSGSPVLVTLFLCIGMALMGFTTVLWELFELFPTNIRYSGTSLAFYGWNHRAFAPMIAIWLATHYSLTYI